MSDDDFFDSPRVGGSSPKKYSWSKEGTSSEVQSAATRGYDGTANGASRVASASGGKMKTRNAAKAAGDSESESEENDRYKQPCGSSSQGSITKIPTGKSQKYTNESSDSESYSDDERVTGRGSTSRTRGSRSSSSAGSRSSSYSRSRSRSPCSDKDAHSGSNSRQAWGVESTPNCKTNSDHTSSNRPKTAHGRSRQPRRQRQGSNSSDRDRHTKPHDPDSAGSSSVSDTESTVSDSDMTDVSPLNSPQRQTPKASPKKGKRVELVESPLHKDVYRYDVDQRKSRPKSGHADGYQHLLQGDKDSVNLKVLMQAILEMEKEKEEQMQNGAQRKFRVQEAPSIAGSVTSQGSYGLSKKNFSFSNTRVKDIDRENQRLMSQILQHSLKKKKPSPEKNRKPVTASHRLASSAVNRLREQQRIDQENRAMLKRLEGAKATKTLQRDELNRELFNTTYVGVPLGVIHAQKSRTPSRQTKSSPYSGRPGSAPASRRPRSATRSDTSSVMSDATSVATSSSTIKSQRPGAGRGRPKSAHTFGGTRTVSGPNFRAKRPDWESGW